MNIKQRIVAGLVASALPLTGAGAAPDVPTRPSWSASWSARLSSPHFAPVVPPPYLSQFARIEADTRIKEATNEHVSDAALKLITDKAASDVELFKAAEAQHDPYSYVMRAGGAGGQFATAHRMVDGKFRLAIATPEDNTLFIRFIGRDMKIPSGYPGDVHQQCDIAARNTEAMVAAFAQQAQQNQTEVPSR